MRFEDSWRGTLARQHSLFRRLSIKHLQGVSNVAGRLLFSSRGFTVPAGCSSLLPAVQVSLTMSRLSLSNVKGELGCVHSYYA